MNKDTPEYVSQAVKSKTYALRNVRLPQGVVTDHSLPPAADGLVSADLVVSNGRVDWVGPPSQRADLVIGPDLGRAIVWPLPVDCHTHLDKGLVVQRSPNNDGTFEGASHSATHDHDIHQSPEDIRCRAEFALRTAYAHGTAAIRSHVDANPETFDRNFETMCTLAEDWQDRLKLQLCPFTSIEDSTEWISKLAAAAKSQPTSGVLSFFAPSIGVPDGVLDQVFRIASHHELELDFHVDENLDPTSHALDAIAQAVVRNRFDRPVLAGHCCALSVQDDDVVDATLDRVAEAGIGIVALPLCNAYLMDRRAGRTPRRRGLAPVHEMKRRGIRIALASDNIRDGYHAYGDLNLAQLYRDTVRMMHLDHPFADWASTVTATAADLVGLKNFGRIGRGLPANLMVFDARTWPEFVSRPHPPGMILRNGRQSFAALPDFAELDRLEGMEI